MQSPSETLHPIAQELNRKLEAAAPEVFAMLSALGRRLYFPKGILSQGAEAKAKATRMNATIGIATEGRSPMRLPSLEHHLADLDPGEAVDYAPPAGRPGLRERWRETLLAENPALRGKRFSLPITTQALTHGLALAGELFVDPGDTLLLPDKFWENYRLLYEVKLGARIRTFPFFAGRGFDTSGFAKAVAAGSEKLVVLLNFPNNPTGYAPTPSEAEAIVAALLRQAEAGTRLVVLIDDAYFGLFYHLGGRSITESLFGMLANRHPNLLAVKLDGATKELFAWGLRCGFLCFAPGRAEGADAVLEVLDAKTRGAIRAGISNASQLSQLLVETVLASSTVEAERKQKHETLRARAEKVFGVANAPRFRESWETYPFNSGYFMCVKVKDVPAEKVRVHLLEKYGIGLIAEGESDLRVAFSCLELSEIEPLFEALHRAIQELID
jgi:aspartate/methionine/tyrosine aminotransferase